MSHYLSSISVVRPGDCNFEQSFCNWTNEVGTEMTWRRQQGQTLSYGTGPSRDHTNKFHSKPTFVLILLFFKHIFS